MQDDFGVDGVRHCERRCNEGNKSRRIQACQNAVVVLRCTSKRYSEIILSGLAALTACRVALEDRTSESKSQRCVPAADDCARFVCELT